MSTTPGFHTYMPYSTPRLIFRLEDHYDEFFSIREKELIDVSFKYGLDPKSIMELIVDTMNREPRTHTIMIDVAIYKEGLLPDGQ